MVLDAIFYLVRGGIAWRALPADFPPHQTVYALFRRWTRARVMRVQRCARRNGKVYHLSGAAALARDLFIRAIGPRRMLARQDWIYDWRA